LARRPVIWHVRDRIEDDYLPRLVVRAFRTLARILPTYLVANSGATLRTLHLGKGQHGTSIPSGIELGNRTSVVHDGINPSLLHGESGHDDGICRIGLIGRISPWKGQHIFIRAAALVHEKYPKARFVMIGAALFGEERYEGEVRRLPAALGIESVVEFAGFRADVQGAIAQLDLVVHASTTGEPFGQVIIEGMASGKPVIATNGGGVPEIIEDGVTGLLVPMGDVPQMADAICRILANPAFGREMGARARRRVAHDFTVEKTARKVEAVYAEVLGRSLPEACPSPLVA
jgi:glycosyltransferase involved in cell wall biosynthesis